MLGVVGGLAEVWLLTLALAALLVLAGRRLLDLTAPEGRVRSASYGMGAGFFVGLSLYLVCWRALAFVVRDARLSCYLTLLCMLALAAGTRARSATPRRSWSQWASAGVLLTAFSATTIVLWLQPARAVDTATHFGSIHSGRYANPGLFIADHGWIPRLGQNYGQSLLVTTHVLFGLRSPLASLTAWLAASQAFLAIVIFGWLRELVSPARAAAGTFVVLFCNIALSITHVLVFDNGSPLGMTGYADVVASVGTWLIFVDWMCRYCGSPARPPGRTLLLPALMGLAWTAFGPQNNLLGPVVCGGLAMAWGARAGVQQSARLATIVVVLAASTGFGAAAGGLLMPHRFADDVDVPGIHVSDEVPPALLPRLQFAISHHGWLRFGSELDKPSDDQLVSAARTYGPMEVFRSLAFRIESNLWTAGRMMFFPLLGMTALAWMLSSTGSQPESERAALLRNWNASAILSFVTGFTIAFFVSVGGFKWPMTRFLIPGVTLALISLVLAADLAVRERRPRLQIAFWAILVTVATIGPMVEFAALAQRQVAKAGAPGGLSERLRVLLAIHDMVPEGSPFPRL